MNNNFSITLTKNPKAKPDPDKLPFGKIFTDHMFTMDYDPQKGWHDGKVIPYAPLELDPAASVTDRKCSKVSRLTRLKTEKFSFSDLT